MDILVLAPHPFYVDRGTPMDVDILLRALSERGESVDALVYHEGEDRDYDGVLIHRIRPGPWIHDVQPGFSLKKVVCDAHFLFEAWRMVRANRYDVVHAGEESVFIALFFRWLYGIPYVYDMDSSIAQQLVEQIGFLRPFSAVFDAFERLAVRKSLAAAPVCNALADLARRHGASHVVTLHDISQLSNPRMKPSGELRRELGIEGLVLMYVGNLQPYQGIDLLLESFAVAARNEEGVELVIAGGSEDAISSYSEHARRLGVSERVHFIGRWPADRLDELLAEAEVLTAPRIRGINTPMKIFPYLHSGTAVLVTDLPTHNQLLHDGVAYLAPATPEGFASGIVDLCRDPDLRSRLGEAGHRFVEENHTYDAHRQRVDELYDYVETRTFGDAGIRTEASFSR